MARKRGHRPKSRVFCPPCCFNFSKIGSSDSPRVSDCKKPLTGDVRRQGAALIHRSAAQATTPFASYPSARAWFYTVLCEIRVLLLRQPAVGGFDRRDLLVAITMAQLRPVEHLARCARSFEASFRTLAGPPCPRVWSGRVTIRMSGWGGWGFVLPLYRRVWAGVSLIIRPRAVPAELWARLWVAVFPSPRIQQF